MGDVVEDVVVTGLEVLGAVCKPSVAPAPKKLAAASRAAGGAAGVASYRHKCEVRAPGTHWRARRVVQRGAH